MNNIPLNPIQFKFWLNDSLHFPTNIYNGTNITFQIQGSLSIARLTDAYTQIVKEYPPLHSTIHIINDVPCFIESLQYKIPFTVINKPECAEHDGLNILIKKLVYQPFNLEKDFPCRFYLITAGQAFYLLNIFHHIAMDGLTLKSFINRLSKIYNKQCEEDTHYQMDKMLAFNSSLSVNYKAQKERNELYWSQYLDDADLVTATLPVINDDASNDFGQEHTYHFCLGRETTEQCNLYCQKKGTTHFRLYSSVWSIVLSKICNNNKIVLNHSIHLRPKENDDMFGVFVNELPLKYQFTPTMSIQDLLVCTHENRKLEDTHKLTFYQHLLPLLQGKHVIENPEQLFQFSINYPVSFYSISLNLSGCQSSFYSHVIVPINQKLMLEMEDNDDGNCRIRCCSSAIFRIAKPAADYFTAILSDIINGRMEYISQTPPFMWINEEEKIQIIKRNSISGMVPDHINLFLDKFGATVKRYPYLQAVVYKDKSLSYAELDKQSRQIAYLIRTNGVKPHSRIALLMKSSPMCIATIIGIFKAQCSYVPIDSNLPDSRKDFILSDAGCACLFKESGLQIIDKKGKTTPAIVDEAYIIYTSGTTGDPKGVPISHQALGYMIESEKAFFNIETGKRMLQFASLSFDASIFEIFSALFNASTLVIADESNKHDPMALLEYIEHNEVNYAAIPPALLSILPYKELPHLTTIIAGGESTPLDTVRLWSKGRDFINAYGPSENCVNTTMCVVDGGFQMNDIGRPLKGVSCYLLDGNMQLVGDGMEGELYIGGMQLTKGYLGQINKDAFIPNPFLTEEDKENGVNLFLYKTGDKMWRRADGNYIFIGRIDNQIKLNGFRIELGEIESKLQECPDVQKAVATLTDYNGKREISAYIQLADDSSIGLIDIRNELSTRIPKYMLPSKWAIVKDMPLTVNGKIDKHRLPEAGTITKTEALTAPCTTAESILLKIAKEILSTEDIGVTTDLLDAGMSSLMIMDFIMHANESGISDITISTVYKQNTIRKILKDHTNKLYFWAEKYNENKPVIVLISGYPYFSPIYDDFVQVFGKNYSIFVFESYNEFFLWKKDVSLQLLLEHYNEVINQKLKGREIAFMTGLCLSSEISIAFAKYRLKMYPDSTPIRILNMEGVYSRHKSSVAPDTGDKLTDEHIRITQIISDELPSMEYDGELISCMATQDSTRITPEGVIDENPHKALMRIKAREANWKAWQQQIPSAPLYFINCNHWNLLEKNNLLQVNKIIENRWRHTVKEHE